MKKYLLPLLATISLSLSAGCWKKVDQISTLNEQRVYLIISEYGNRYYHMKNDLYRSGVYYSIPDPSSNDYFNNYFTFQLKNAGDGYWNLYNVCRGSYVNATVYSPASLIDKPDGVEPSKWLIDDKYIKSHIADNLNLVFVLRNRNYYGLVSESVTKKVSHAKPYEYLYPKIYELSTLTLDENSDFPSYLSSFDVDSVVLKRTFVDNVKNTLILPFDVPNYKKVFGDNVVAYEYSCVEGNTINFTEIDSDKLNANTPYLIKGSSFNASPYTIDATTIYPVSSGQKYNGNVIGAYKSMQAKNGYILTAKGIIKYNESNEKPLLIQPYRWYFNSNISNAKLNLIDNHVSSISKIKYNHSLRKVFDIQGRVVSEDYSNFGSLPKGIYIVGGKKVVKD